MDAIAEKALDKSIEKWEKIVDGTGVDDGINNCALCVQYQDFFCEGCPVYEKTEITGCKNTPYTEWESHWENNHLKGFDFFPRKIMCDECKKLAQKELDFLRSLKPKKKDEQ